MSEVDPAVIQKLKDFIESATLKSNQNNYQRLQQELDCIQKYRPKSIQKWYIAMSQAIPFMSFEEYGDLWRVVFERFRWDFPRCTLAAYCEFCLSLARCQPACLEQLLKSLVFHFIDRPSFKCVPPSDGQPQGNRDIALEMIHGTLRELYKHRPTMPLSLLPILVAQFPCVKTSSGKVLQAYTQQLFLVCAYMPDVRERILQLILEQLIKLDLSDYQENPRSPILFVSSSNNYSDDEDLFAEDTEPMYEDDEKLTSLDTNSTLGKLDDLMALVLEYIDVCNDDFQSLSRVYHDFMVVFERSILPTLNLSHTQFLLFYITSLRPQFAEHFLSRLIEICLDVKTSIFDRCMAASYIGGFVSKAKFLRHASASIAFDQLSGWLVEYIAFYQERCPVGNIHASNVKNHPLFYSLAQAAFRIFCHHAHNFEEVMEMLQQMESRLSKIVQCPLQPLKYCHPELVEEFLSVCDRVDIEGIPEMLARSNELSLTSFVHFQLFPFDTYILPLSGAYIKPLFRIYGEESPPRCEEDTKSGFTLKNEPLTPTLEGVAMDVDDDEFDGYEL